MPPEHRDSVLRNPERYLRPVDDSNFSASNDNYSEVESDVPNYDDVEQETEPEKELKGFGLDTKKGLREISKLVKEESDYLTNEISEYGESNLSPVSKAKYDYVKILFSSVQQLISDARAELRKPLADREITADGIQSAVDNINQKIDDLVGTVNAEAGSNLSSLSESQGAQSQEAQEQAPIRVNEGWQFTIADEDETVRLKVKEDPKEALPEEVTLNRRSDPAEITVGGDNTEPESPDSSDVREFTYTEKQFSRLRKRIRNYQKDVARFMVLKKEPWVKIHDESLFNELGANIEALTGILGRGHDVLSGVRENDADLTKLAEPYFNKIDSIISTLKSLRSNTHVEQPAERQTLNIEQPISIRQADFDFSSPEGVAEVSDFVESQQAQLNEFISEYGFLNLDEENREQYQNVLALAAGVKALLDDSKWKLTEGKGGGFLDRDKIEELLDKLLKETDILFKSIEARKRLAGSTKNLTATYEAGEEDKVTDPDAVSAEDPGNENSDEVGQGAVVAAAGAATALASAGKNVEPAEEISNLPEALTDYEQLRLKWLEAKDYHERAHQLYQEKVAEYYEGIKQTEGTGKRLWERMRATAGFKRELPKEYEEERLKVLRITARYNELGRQMIEARRYVGKEAAPVATEENGLVTEEQQKKQAVYERYQRMLGRTTITNTFDDEMKSQEAAMEALKIKPPKFFREHPNITRILGAAIIGGLASSVTVGANAFLRMVVGGTLSAAAAGFINKHYEGKIENINVEFDEMVGQIEQKLTAGGMTAEELQETYQFLTSIYSRVDSEKRKRLRDIIITAIAIGEAAGFGIEKLSAVGIVPDVDQQIFGSYNNPSTDVGQLNNDAARSYSAAADAVSTDVPPSPQALDSYADSDGSAVPNQVPESVSAATAAETTDATRVAGLTKAGEALPTAYEANVEDNYWDIMAGKTDAGSMPVVEQVAAEHRQALIDLTRDALNENEALRTEIGFGDKMDNLGEGSEVNVQKLHAVAVEIAEKEGWLGVPPVENVSDAASADVGNGIESDGGDVANDNETAQTTAEPAQETVQTPEPKASAEAATPLNNQESSAASEAGGTEKVASTDSLPVAEVAAVSEAANDNFDGAPSNTYEYVLKNFETPSEFEKDFREEWVDKIQATGAVKNSGLFGFGGEPYMDAFHHFEAMNIYEFNKLAVLSPVELKEYLDLHDINPADYEAWSKVTSEWQRDPNIHFTVEDRFEEVAKAAYIERVLEAKRVAA